MSEDTTQDPLSEALLKKKARPQVYGTDDIETLLCNINWMRTAYRATSVHPADRTRLESTATQHGQRMHTLRSHKSNRRHRPLDTIITCHRVAYTSLLE